VGQTVELTVPAHPDRVFDGEVATVSPSIMEATRSFTVKARLGNQELELKPGGFGRAVLVLEKRTGKPLVPEESLVPLRGGYIVFVVEDGVAHRREVEVGLRELGRAEIVEGLEPGEKIVRLGHMRLSDGTPVEPMKPEDQGTTGSRGNES
jgi:membrane fusion protein (multidrug efflux system)